MKNENSSVLLVADVYDSDLAQNLTQEWENLESIEYIKSCLEESGELVELVGSPPDLLNRLSFFTTLPFSERPVLFHLLEGFLSRNREAWLPALAEYFGFPHTGSDAYAHTLSLDKHASKLFSRSLGIPTANWGCIEGIDFYEEMNSVQGFPDDSEFPIFLKPRYEGSSLGIGQSNIVSSRASLNQFLQEKGNSHSSWIWESYLPGEEWTVAVIGSPKEGYRVSQVARICLENSDETVYGQLTKTKSSMPERLIFDLDPERSELIRSFSLSLCRKVRTTGAVRLDWKSTLSGHPQFLEWNTTPGLSPFYSSFPICYTREFGNYSSLLSDLLRMARSEFQEERFGYAKMKSSKGVFDRR
ncbi:D-alanine--D-alanine ligase C-terminal domain protein [Leptospira fainei serovar Hurstbridge str. BUT 6]|uniref:D-alanine--D-alanine ligase C-terminal domain protein n=1 Tax=Leptospira fainei serovar Hurstbridge str. BUT 6 TaxID=1193011 RepID=S3VE64_9LEPT|nr:D-alanine--D-alanine ligase [Leptospira fainei]EPG74790.1 D-alanine--D-alanine ligase C-terminal domain protein [Leptospira fainei serovar Hurstbridge str. BUT 6]